MKTLIIATVLAATSMSAAMAQTITLSNGWTVQCTTMAACGQGVMAAEGMAPIQAPTYNPNGYTGPSVASAIDLNIDWSKVKF